MNVLGHIYIYKYTASTTSQLTGLGMCRFYQIAFSGEIYCSAHKDICRYVYILLALPFSSLGWVCAGFTRGLYFYVSKAFSVLKRTKLWGFCEFCWFSKSSLFFEVCTACSVFRRSKLYMYIDC